MLRGQITDDFEQWIKEEYEDPALSSICKLEAGKKLSKENIHNLVKFLALQDIRTPQNYSGTLGRWKENFPKIADQVLKEFIKKSVKDDISNLDSHKKTDTPFAKAISVNTFPVDTEEMRKIYIKISATFDRDTWIDEQKHLLKNVANRLLSHSWKILEATPPLFWYASDHPVVRLNYYGPYHFDLQGGWDRDKGNVFMPLTPKYLLFTQIRDSIVDNPVLSLEKHLNLMILFLCVHFVTFFLFER